MTASSPPRSRLTSLQRELLDAFFALDRQMFLTGGAALAGYWLGHRATDDLDLFAFPGVDADQALRTLEVAARGVGASSRVMQSYPVVDHAPAIESDKRVVGEVRLDSPREIAANKVCALVGRSEIRDLVDLRALLGSGCDLAQAIDDAQRKDAGADAATLAWLLSQLEIGPEAKLPGGIDPADLAAFRDGLVVELRRLAARDVRRGG